MPSFHNRKQALEPGRFDRTEPATTNKHLARWVEKLAGPCQPDSGTQPRQQKEVEWGRSPRPRAIFCNLQNGMIEPTPDLYS